MKNFAFRFNFSRKLRSHCRSLALLLVFPFGAVFADNHAAHPSGSSRAKNIVFITFDELAAAQFGSYGSGVNSTPTMDRMADQGIRFERVYPPIPVCGPSRAAWLTGRTPVVNGIIFNNLVLSPDVPTFPSLLKAHGYRTGMMGKLHQTPMMWPEPEDFAYLGFDEAVISEDDKWGDYIDWVAEKHPEWLDAALSLARGPPQSKSQAHLAERKERAVIEVLNPILDASFFRYAYESPLPPEVHDTVFITDSGIDFMERHLEEHGDQPFFCHISYVDPHDPYNPPAPYSTMFDPEDIPPHIPMRWDPEEQPMLAETLKHLNISELHDRPEDMAKMRALFHGSLRFCDDQIARIDAFLTENDLWKDTIVIISTDHGSMLGNHGLITKGSKHYDAGIRVPLIVLGAGVVAGQVSPRLTNSLDFYPTFMDWAGVGEDLRPPLEGKSFAEDCQGQPTEGWKDLVLWASETVGGAYTLVTDDGWRYTQFVLDDGRVTGQLFNLIEDPNEQDDLYRKDDYAVLRNQLNERLTATLTRPARIPQYRNMPYIGGLKRIRDYSERNLRAEIGIPYYEPLPIPEISNEN